jgi:hypothetical protein
MRRIIGVDDDGELILGPVTEKGEISNIRHCSRCVGLDKD